MKIEKTYNAEYVDAYCSYTKTITKINGTSLLVCNAYGFVERNGDNIIIVFIKKHRSSVKKLIRGKGKIIEGLVIPDTSLVSHIKKHKKKDSKILKNISINSSVSVVWRDVVHVANMAVHNCFTMYTEGILIRIESDHIVLKNPETIRAEPPPIKNHPLERPNFYIIPIGFIKDISIID